MKLFIAKDRDEKIHLFVGYKPIWHNDTGIWLYQLTLDFEKFVVRLDGDEVQDLDCGEIIEVSFRSGVFDKEKRKFLAEKRKLLEQKLENSDNYYRAAGDCLCEGCGYEYRLHPIDTDDPCLTILCNDDRVKL